MSTWIDRVENSFKDGCDHNDDDDKEDSCDSLINKTQKLALAGGSKDENTEANLRRRLANVQNAITQISNKELRCIFWNCGGLISKMDKKTKFLDLVFTYRPDLIFLNEIKCKDVPIDGKKVIEKLAAMLDYECIYTCSSVSDNGRAMRGSAILYREGNGKLKYVKDSARPVQNTKMERVSATFKFGDVDHKFICLYLAPDSGAATKKELIKYLRQIPDTGLTIAVGDFNLEKNEHRAELENETEFMDVLHGNIKTNYSSKGNTSIDYIMKKGIDEEIEYRWSKPKGNGHGHAMFAFTIPLPS